MFEIPTGTFALTYRGVLFSDYTFVIVRCEYTYLFVIIHPFTIFELDFCERRSLFNAITFPSTLG